MKKPRIVLFDVETLPAIVATFTLYPDSINHENILQDWSINCICWKDLGKKVKSVSVMDDPKRFKADPLDDYYVLKTIREEFDDVDILIGHNSINFDVKKLNARLIYHDLPPMPKILMLDTLKEIRKAAAFTSNRLDYLGKHLLGEGKAETSRGLWLRCLRGDTSAIKEMVKYCAKDVTLLEKLYLKIRPYLKAHPNIATVEDLDHCPKCDSDNTKKNGVRRRATGVLYQSYMCIDCGGHYSGVKAMSKVVSRV